jgi:hypothetical protein
VKLVKYRHGWIREHLIINYELHITKLIDMKKWQIIILVIILIGILGGIYGYFFVYNKPHTDYEKADADVVISAKAIYNAFKEDKVKATKEYNGKVVQIKGTMKMIEEKNSLITVVFVFSQGDFGDEGIRCTLLPKFNEEIKTLKPDDYINIKGYCTGFNDTDVIIEKCSIVQN